MGEVGLVESGRVVHEVEGQVFHRFPKYWVTGHSGKKSGRTRGAKSKPFEGVVMRRMPKDLLDVGSLSAVWVWGPVAMGKTKSHTLDKADSRSGGKAASVSGFGGVSGKTSHTTSGYSSGPRLGSVLGGL